MPANGWEGEVRAHTAMERTERLWKAWLNHSASMVPRTYDSTDPTTACPTSPSESATAIELRGSATNSAH
eukprot:2648908-Rhodomonas_salina.1